MHLLKIKWEEESKHKQKLRRRMHGRQLLGYLKLLAYLIILMTLVNCMITQVDAASDPTSSKSLRIPILKGKSNYTMWLKQFIAYATFYKFTRMLKEVTATADLPATEDDPGGQIRIHKSRKMQ